MRIKTTKKEEVTLSLLKCPACGANVTINKGDTEVTCLACGSTSSLSRSETIDQVIENPSNEEIVALPQDNKKSRKEEIKAIIDDYQREHPQEASSLVYEPSDDYLLPKRGQKFSRFAAYMKRNWPLYAMLIPMILYFLVFNYYPMAGIVLAFKKWSIQGQIWGSPWCRDESGNLDLFKNFKTLFDDPDFMPKFLNTIRISGLRILIGFPVPIILTILLNEMRAKKYAKTFQIVSYLPHFISWVIISGILKSLTASLSSFQEIMTRIFGHEIEFFTDPNLFMWLLIFSNIWKSAGWGTIIYFAALAGINPDLYEAADIDGASRWNKIIHITLPGLVPAISINLILTASGFIHAGFDQIFNMYSPEVYETSDVIETYLFRIGITDGKYSLAAALGLFNSSISLVMVIISNKIIKLIGGDSLW